VTADQGRIEINQACAAAGCFAGDSAGFPVTISVSGTYALGGDLAVSDPAQDGIAITEAPATGSLVTIDLRGFEIAGPVACSGMGPTLNCGAGSGIGISAAGPSTRMVVVKNGRIRGFGAGAIALGDRARLEGVAAERNGTQGLSAGVTSIVRGCTAQLNAGVGIQVGTASIVQDSTAAENRLGGILGAGVGVLVTRSATRGNGGDGISTLQSGLIRKNTAYQNYLSGITAGEGSNVIDNTSYGNSGGGISALDGSTLNRNTVWFSSGSVAALSLGSGAAYHQNKITAVIPVSGGVSMGENSCNGSSC
jgi:hypothetical protein